MTTRSFSRDAAFGSSDSARIGLLRGWDPGVPLAAPVEMSPPSVLRDGWERAYAAAAHPVSAQTVGVIAAGLPAPEAPTGPPPLTSQEYRVRLGYGLAVGLAVTLFTLAYRGAR
ncbi:MAG: hypothetical protein RLZZ299_1436 [Pseudomonadota bacterium]|jgi:hypothetical protein